MMGRYVSCWQMEIDMENPVGSVRNYLKESGKCPEKKEDAVFVLKQWCDSIKILK